MKGLLMNIAMVLTVLVAMTAGGIITAGVSADEPETVEPEAVEMIEPETIKKLEPDALEPETTKTEEPETEATEATADNTPAGIIESQTGLTVDSVKQFDSYGNWAAYEVFADGDIYAITIKNNSVDVVAILN